MKRPLLFPAVFLAAALLAAAVGCDTAGLSQNGNGTIRVLMTDAPIDNVAEAHVTIRRVELVGEAGVVVLSDEDQEFDLLELQNGLTADLAIDEVPDGEYHQLRIIVDEEATLVFKDGSTATLKIPSGAQTGIKIDLPEFEINGDADEAEILIDFDASKSFVKAGASGKWIFKPVIHAERIAVNGEELDEGIEVTGTVTALSDTSIAVEGIGFALTSEAEIEVEEEDTLAAGQFVELEADTTRLVLEIETEDPEENAEVKAPIDQLNAASLVVLGVTFEVTAETEFENGLTGLTNLAEGRFVEIEFAYDAEADTYTALKIEPEPLADDDDTDDEREDD